MISRVALALDRPNLQRQLRQRLQADEVIVDVVKGKQRMWTRLTREICDLVVVSTSRIPRPHQEMIGLLCEVPDAPGVVILLEQDDPEQRAQLLGAGCTAVLDAGIAVDSLVDVLQTIVEQRRALARQRLAGAGLFTQPLLRDFVSNSPVMQAFLEVVQRVVNSTISILVLGETGVGKERLARAIHNESSRSGGPFVAMNCGALPESLLESELFGHEEGAFTGATRSRRGCFELAHGGTVFLDEIGDLPVHLQVKLLRVLQDREVRRLGGERALTVDVRIMAATNRDLEEAVRQGAFRRDLFYRLNVMTLTLPPLRERREDIEELALNYVAYLRPRIGCEVTGITREALEALGRYPWPGNVRELINVIERAMLLCPGQTITLAELPVTISRSEAAALTAAALIQGASSSERLPSTWLERPWKEVRQLALERVERAYLAGLLHQTGGAIGTTATMAGMQPRSLFEKMRRLGLCKEDYRPVE